MSPAAVGLSVLILAVVLLASNRVHSDVGLMGSLLPMVLSLRSRLYLGPPSR